MQALPLPSNQFFILAILYSRGALNISEIARMMGISKQQMTPVVKHLTECGYIIKSAHPSDKRSSTLAITAKGSAIIDSHHNELSELLSEIITQSLSAEEIETLTKSIKICFSLLDKLS
jgi:DNA-binding MarR family transcriptional regulator